MEAVPAAADPSRSAAEEAAVVAPRVELIGREGCHLCDDARAVVTAVTADLGEAFVERDLDADPALAARYADEIPVVLVDGQQVAFWRVDPDQLRAALTGRDRRRPWRRRPASAP
jgi:hypothetical protein